ncbi:MAG: right-handed parallel beta-helix repeat-containing protein [Bryobacteraceae bacterium]|jgi:hypothetical protein
MTSKSVFSIFVLAATVFVLPAFAVDGTTLINQATVVAAGGFPYNITQTGSYRLSGNLVASNTQAISITAANVTLDLNGFTISCSGCAASYIGIIGTAAGTVVENGNVTGYSGSSGLAIYLEAGGKVDHMGVTGNYNGIASGGSLTITNCNVSNNVRTGINSFTASRPELIVLNSVISSNGRDGIDIANGLISGNTISANGAGPYSGVTGGIIVFGGTVTVTNNVISNNNYGIGEGTGAGTSTIGYGSNTFGENGTDIDPFATNLYSMKNNVNATGLF